jgi:hypothetical protein
VSDGYVSLPPYGHGPFVPVDAQASDAQEDAPNAARDGGPLEAAADATTAAEAPSEGATGDHD